MNEEINRKEFLKSLSVIVGSSILLPKFLFSDEKTIYLTIDDGPKQGMDMILKNTGKNNKITFFMLGGFLKNKEKFNKACRALELGHEIGNHSYSHPSFSGISINRAKKEIEDTDNLIEKIYLEAGCKRKIKFFRFPFGDPGYYNKKARNIAEAIGCKNPILLRCPYDDIKYHDFGKNGIGNKEKRIEIAFFLRDFGYSTYFWNFDSKDYVHYTDNLPLENILNGIKKTQNLDVVLAHDLYITAKYVIPRYSSLGYSMKALEN